MSPAKIAKLLTETGIAVCPDFLSHKALRELREDFQEIYSSGKFKPAGVGQHENRQVHNFIRRGEIFWLNRAEGTPIRRRLWSRLDTLKKAFNRQLPLNLEDFECQYSKYPEGGFYKKHKDSFKTDNRRAISLILYLNENWKPEDGGRLRIYNQDQYYDIDPTGGKLVCFMSRDVQHEVRVSHAARLSFTGWFLTKTT